MIAYIIAGAILGFYSIEVCKMAFCHHATIPLSINILLAFVGGVGGHLAFTLLNKLT